MQTATNQLQTADNKPKTFSQLIQTKGYQDMINSAIQEPKRRNRFVTAVVSAVSANPLLQQCLPHTVLSSALQGEALDLSPSAVMGEYAIVPYKKWDKNKGAHVYEAQFQIMTGGRVQLAMRSGLYRTLNAIEIRQGEYKGKDKRTGMAIIDFIENDEQRLQQPVVGYYAYFELLNGFFNCVYLSKADVIHHAKSYSKAFNYDIFLKVQKGEKLADWKEEASAETPWIKHFDEMAKNLALRKLLKNAPKSIEMRTAEEVEGENEQANLASMVTAQEQTADEFFAGTENDEIVEEVKADEKPKRTTKKKAETVQDDFFDGETKTEN